MKLRENHLPSIMLIINYFVGRNKLFCERQLGDIKHFSMKLHEFCVIRLCDVCDNMSLLLRFNLIQ